MNRNSPSKNAFQPDVVVLIPHYNNIKGLIKTLSSINEEEAVDVVIVDDGSKEPPKKEDLPTNSSVNQLIVLCLEVNKGIAHAINTGLSYAIKDNYKYFGILDCDDRPLKNKFFIQKNYLNEHKDIGLLGAQCNYVDVNGNFMYCSNNPLKNNDIVKTNNIFNPFIHPTIIFRACVIKESGLYPTRWRYNIENAFFYEVFKKFKVENLSSVLLDCQVNTQSYSPSNYRKQRYDKISMIIHYFETRYALYAVAGIVKNLIAMALGYKIMFYMAKVLKK